jgi:hypothetical protein
MLKRRHRQNRPRRQRRNGETLFVMICTCGYYSDAEYQTILEVQEALDEGDIVDPPLLEAMHELDAVLEEELTPSGEPKNEEAEARIEEAEADVIERLDEAAASVDEIKEAAAPVIEDQETSEQAVALGEAAVVAAEAGDWETALDEAEKAVEIEPMFGPLVQACERAVDEAEETGAQMAANRSRRASRRRRSR